MEQNEIYKTALARQRRNEEAWDKLVKIFENLSLGGCFKKSVALLVCLALGSGSLMSSATGAYFSDTASVEGVTFSVSTLDFYLSPQDNFLPDALDKGETAQFSTSLVKSGDLGFKYSASTTDIGTSDLCGSLNLEAKFNDAVVYDGPLTGFYLQMGSYTEPAAWSFGVTLPSDAPDSLEDQICSFKVRFDGWQENLPQGQGFSDFAEIGALISSGHWTVTPPVLGVVLNEFLPNPQGNQYGHDFGTDDDIMPKGEWVELYNNSDTAQDLSGWYIRDSLDIPSYKIMIDTAHTGFTTPVIPAKGFLVVFMNGSLFNNTLSSGESDSVRLFNSSDVLVDSYTYTLPADYCNLEPTQGSTNDETGSGVGGECTYPVPTNKSYARIPDGVGEWIDPIPTPGQTNDYSLMLEENSLMQVGSSPIESAVEPLGDTANEGETEGEGEGEVIVDTEQIDREEAILPEGENEPAEEPTESTEEPVSTGEPVEESFGGPGEEPKEVEIPQAQPEPVTEPMLAPEPTPSESPALETPISE